MSSSTYSPDINHSGQDSLTRIFLSSNILVRTWGLLKKKTNPDEKKKTASYAVHVCVNSLTPNSD